MTTTINPSVTGADAPADDPEPTLELVLDGHSLTIPQVATAARHTGELRVSLATTAVARMERSRALKQRLIEAGQPIYGVTTGFGDSCIRQISPEKAADLQRHLIRYHLNGSGPLAPRDVVRAAMLIRANCLVRGYSGVRTEVVELLLACLEGDILPLIPQRGSVGASGDLVPLCYLASMLIGNGDVDHRGRRTTAAAALAECGLTPLRLEAKEALGLINGTSFMAGFAVLAAADARELALVADIGTAMASEALLGNRGHFDRFIHAQKPHPGQRASAAAIDALLEGSELSMHQSQILEAIESLGERTYLELGHRIQDKYSIRCAPHVTGMLRDTLRWVEEWLTVEINSCTDNPLFDIDGDVVHNGGNFYGGHVAQAMDALKIAVANLADLLDRQVELLVDEKFNNGLTPNLIPRIEPGSYEEGLHHGYKGMQIACSALTAEALKNAAPASVFSRSTEAHNQDKVSMGTIAARDACSVVELVQNVAAIHLHAVCQALDLRGADRAAPRTLAAYQVIRDRAPFVDGDRRLDGEVADIVGLIQQGAVGRAVSGLDSLVDAGA